MAQFLPINLSGDNLGDRQHYLNLQVHQAVKDRVSFQDIRDVAERTPADRLFKIELAIKLKNIDFILKNLKDDDMLYVSRALKCKWLLEQLDIINPKYLEDVLFPEMVIPAVSKMKHWLYINLRDPIMCQTFYQYYKNSKFDFAMKFLSHCGNEFVLNEFPKILTKLTPHYLKVFAEKSPEFAKIYFDALETDNDLVKRYLRDERKFYESFKCVLKTNADIFLDITEKYHNLTFMTKLSPSATDYILQFHKSRFMAKSELYIVYILHMPTVARRLNDEETQDVMIKLARAGYLSWWFSYENVEPLFKRFSSETRVAFKIRVFVEKVVGERVTSCPYELPHSPVAKNTSIDKSHVFQDINYELIHVAGHQVIEKQSLNGTPIPMSCCLRMSSGFCPDKSELQKLFDEFRYVGFNPTFHELRSRIGATKSADRRRDILLVLVSKSVGRAEYVRALLQLALRLRNEPVHERASVVRSLVKRAHAWRFPQDVWDTMLVYARGLGLDGSRPQAECREGLHAVVLRQLLDAGDCEPAVRNAFLNEFSTLFEYKLLLSERVKIAASLQHLLLTAIVAEVEPTEAARYLNQLVDVLENYHISIKTSQVVSVVKALAERDWEIVRPILVRLYNARVGRRELFCHYLKFRHDDAALMNVLRHEPEAITPEWVVNLLAEGKTPANQFLLKLAVYFKETGGLADQIQHSLLEKISQKPEVNLARPLATLVGSDISTLWRQQDEAGGEHYKIAAALRANMHRARPAPDALALGWRQAGLKAVASRAMRSRPLQVAQLIQTLLEERAKRPVRLALSLAQRSDYAVDMFSKSVRIRPLASLRAAFFYYRKFGDAADPRIWDLVKSFILNTDLIPREGLLHILKKKEWVPSKIKLDYCAVMYVALRRISDDNANSMLRVLMKSMDEVNENLLDNVMLRILANIDDEKHESYPAIVIRYLMLSKSNNQLKTRIEKIGDTFLAKLYAHRDVRDETIIKQHFFQRNLTQITSSLQYNVAFFNIKYQCCLPVMKWVLFWMEKFMPREIYFDYYAKVHATMLYFKAVRNSIEQNPEVFKDPVQKISEGLDIVGFTLGKYIVKEVNDLKVQYFDSIVKIYSDGLMANLNEIIMCDSYRTKFIMAIIKGIISESVNGEARLAIHIAKFQYNIDREEIIDLVMKSDDMETKFFLFADAT